MQLFPVKRKAVSHCSCRLSRGFSLVEVVMSISIVSFAMLPVMGLLGVGMNAAQDSIKSSTSAHILQQVQTLVQNQDVPPFYFSSAGDKVASTTEAMYEVSIQPGTIVNDATKGLAAKKLSTIIIKRLGTASPVEYARTFTVTSQNPATLWQGQ
ncbi:MAG: prepilin-type N-terminal cleavage/methylation domain-containing protein [Candidatus Methylacidiphilales bacterium]